MKKQRYIEAGQIVGTHGVRGEVRIQPWADSPEFLTKFKTLYIDGKPVAVRSARVQKNVVVAALEGAEDVNAAMALKGRKVCIDRQDADLPGNACFLVDIIGADVVDESGAELGKLVDIIEMPTQNVYVVRGAAEHLVPDVPEFIRSVDAEKGVITVRLIEGM
jgi:16S rRNA processing protein RimM